jgi:O-antigen/teichoic acid export membrane protein
MDRRFASAGRKMLSGSVLRLINLVAAALVALLLMPFIVHRLGDRLYGFWSLTGGFIAYYGLLDFGLGVAVSQYICVALGRSELAECRAIFNTALRIQTLFGGVALLATGILAVAAPWFCHSPADASLFSQVIVILGVSAALGFPARAYSGVLDAELRFDIQSWLPLLGLALRTGLVVGAILAGGGLLALAWATLIGTLPVPVLQVWFARRQAPWARIEGSWIERKRAKNLFSYSVYMFASNIADMLRFQVDPLVISGFIGLAAVTHYRIASIFIVYYVSIVCSCTGMFQPILSRLSGAEDRDGLEKVFFFATKVSVCISVFIGFSFIFWGRPFIGRWMGTRYDDAYWPMVVLSLAVLLDLVQAPSVNLLFATFKHRSYAYINGAEGLINLVVSLVLARPLGLLGVALGTLIAAFVIRVAVQPWWVCKAVGLHYGRYMMFVGLSLLRCGCLTGVAIGVSAWGLKPSFPHLVSSAICATLVYAAGSWMFVFNGSERERLRAVISSRGQLGAEIGVVAAAL